MGRSILVVLLAMILAISPVSINPITPDACQSLLSSLLLAIASA